MGKARLRISVIGVEDGEAKCFTETSYRQAIMEGREIFEARYELQALTPKKAGEECSTAHVISSSTDRKKLERTLGFMISHEFINA
jgi:hypothetical protein